MTTNISSYYDFASLAQLKSSDSVKQQENSRSVLEKFEALFIDQMLQSMRKATQRSELFDSDGIKLYESLFDKEISEELARGSGLGLRSGLEDYLGFASVDLEGTASRVNHYLPLERDIRTNTTNRSKALSLYSKHAMDL